MLKEKTANDRIDFYPETLTPNDVVELLRVAKNTALRLMRQMPHTDAQPGNKRALLRVKKSEFKKRYWDAMNTPAEEDNANAGQP